MWVVLFDYNNNLSLDIYVVLMFCYVYVFVKYDYVCVGNILNILCRDVFVTLMKTWLT